MAEVKETIVSSFSYHRGDVEALDALARIGKEDDRNKSYMIVRAVKAFIKQVEQAGGIRKMDIKEYLDREPLSREVLQAMTDPQLLESERIVGLETKRISSEISSRKTVHLDTGEEIVANMQPSMRENDIAYYTKKLGSEQKAIEHLNAQDAIRRETGNAIL